MNGRVVGEFCRESKGNKGDFWNPRVGRSMIASFIRILDKRRWGEKKTSISFHFISIHTIKGSSRFYFLFISPPPSLPFLSPLNQPASQPAK